MAAPGAAAPHLREPGSMDDSPLGQLSRARRWLESAAAPWLPPLKTLLRSENVGMPQPEPRVLHAAARRLHLTAQAGVHVAAAVIYTILAVLIRTGRAYNIAFAILHALFAQGCGLLIVADARAAGACTQGSAKSEEPSAWATSASVAGSRERSAAHALWVLATAALVWTGGLLATSVDASLTLAIATSVHAVLLYALALQAGATMAQVFYCSSVMTAGAVAVTVALAAPSLRLQLLRDGLRATAGSTLQLCSQLLLLALMWAAANVAAAARFTLARRCTVTSAALAAPQAERERAVDEQHRAGLPGLRGAGTPSATAGAQHVPPPPQGPAEALPPIRVPPSTAVTTPGAHAAAPSAAGGTVQGDAQASSKTRTEQAAAAAGSGSSGGINGLDASADGEGPGSGTPSAPWDHVMVERLVASMVGPLRDSLHAITALAAQMQRRQRQQQAYLQRHGAKAGAAPVSEESPPLLLVLGADGPSSAAARVRGSAGAIDGAAAVAAAAATDAAAAAAAREAEDLEDLVELAARVREQLDAWEAEAAAYARADGRLQQPSSRPRRRSRTGSGGDSGGGGSDAPTHRSGSPSPKPGDGGAAECEPVSIADGTGSNGRDGQGDDMSSGDGAGDASPFVFGDAGAGAGAGSSTPGATLTRPLLIGNASLLRSSGGFTPPAGVALGLSDDAHVTSAPGPAAGRPPLPPAYLGPRRAIPASASSGSIADAAQRRHEAGAGYGQRHPSPAVPSPAATDAGPAAASAPRGRPSKSLTLQTALPPQAVIMQQRRASPASATPRGRAGQQSPLSPLALPGTLPRGELAALELARGSGSLAHAAVGTPSPLAGGRGQPAALPLRSPPPALPGLSASSSAGSNWLIAQAAEDIMSAASASAAAAAAAGGSGGGGGIGRRADVAADSHAPPQWAHAQERFTASEAGALGAAGSAPLTPSTEAEHLLRATRLPDVLQRHSQQHHGQQGTQWYHHHQQQQQQAPLGRTRAHPGKAPSQHGGYPHATHASFASHALRPSEHEGDSAGASAGHADVNRAAAAVQSAVRKMLLQRYSSAGTGTAEEQRVPGPGGGGGGGGGEGKQATDNMTGHVVPATDAAQGAAAAAAEPAVKQTLAGLPAAPAAVLGASGAPVSADAGGETPSGCAPGIGAATLPPRPPKQPPFRARSTATISDVASVLAEIQQQARAAGAAGAVTLRPVSVASPHGRQWLAPATPSSHGAQGRRVFFAGGAQHAEPKPVAVAEPAEQGQPRAWHSEAAATVDAETLTPPPRVRVCSAGNSSNSGSECDSSVAGVLFSSRNRDAAFARRRQRRQRAVLLRDRDREDSARNVAEAEDEAASEAAAKTASDAESEPGGGAARHGQHRHHHHRHSHSHHQPTTGSRQASLPAPGAPRLRNVYVSSASASASDQEGGEAGEAQAPSAAGAPQSASSPNVLEAPSEALLPGGGLQLSSVSSGGSDAGSGGDVYPRLPAAAAEPSMTDINVVDCMDARVTAPNAEEGAGGAEGEAGADADADADADAYSVCSTCGEIIYPEDEEDEGEEGEADEADGSAALEGEGEGGDAQGAPDADDAVPSFVSGSADAPELLSPSTATRAAGAVPAAAAAASMPAAGGGDAHMMSPPGGELPQAAATASAPAAFGFGSPGQPVGAAQPPQGPSHTPQASLFGGGSSGGGGAPVPPSEARDDSTYVFDIGFEHQYGRKLGLRRPVTSRRQEAEQAAMMRAQQAQREAAAKAGGEPGADGGAGGGAALAEALGVSKAKLAATTVRGQLTDAAAVLLGVAKPTHPTTHDAKATAALPPSVTGGLAASATHAASTTPTAGSPRSPRTASAPAPLGGPTAPAKNADAAATAPSAPSRAGLSPAAGSPPRDGASTAAPAAAATAPAAAAAGAGMPGRSAGSEDGAVAGGSAHGGLGAPDAAGPAAGAGSTLIADPVASGPLPKFNLHVLVVDDERVNRKIAARFLAQLGCSSEQVEDGDEVVSALVLSARPFDAILLDILMRRSNGLQVCHMLREQHVEVPIIAATAAYSHREKALYQAAGFDRVLTKPFNVRDLAAVLAYATNVQLQRGIDPAARSAGGGEPSDKAGSDGDGSGHGSGGGSAAHVRDSAPGASAADGATATSTSDGGGSAGGGDAGERTFDRSAALGDGVDFVHPGTGH